MLAAVPVRRNLHIVRPIFAAQILIRVLVAHHLRVFKADGGGVAEHRARHYPSQTVVIIGAEPRRVIVHGCGDGAHGLLQTLRRVEPARKQRQPRRGSMAMFIRVAVNEIECPFQILIAAELPMPSTPRRPNAVERKHIHINTPQEGQMRLIPMASPKAHCNVWEP